MQTSVHDYLNPVDQYHILTQGSREQIIDWLEWNDPDGLYNDDAAELEGFAPLTFEILRATMRATMREQTGFTPSRN